MNFPTTRAYSTAMTDASVGVKRPPRMPYRMSTVIMIAQKALKNDLTTTDSGCRSPFGYPRRTEMTYTTAMSRMPISTPGTMPATNILPTEMPVSVPTMIMGRLGGMIGPMVEAEATSAEANPASYLSLFMAGMSTEPRLAVSASAVPEIPANTMEEPTVARPSPPRMNPMTELAN